MYSHGIDDESDLRKRVVTAADHFIECGPMKPHDRPRPFVLIASMCCFELKGFTLDSRLATFAFRAAPICRWLGYPRNPWRPFIDFTSLATLSSRPCLRKRTTPKTLRKCP